MLSRLVFGSLRITSPIRVLSLVTLVLVAACLPGAAKPPNVTPQRTLDMRLGELGDGRPAEGEFGVVFAGPRGLTADPTEVSIVFNRPMRPLELAGDPTKDEESFAGTVHARGAKKESVPVAGKWRWLGTSAVVFVPDRPLMRATEYVVTVPGGSKAEGGATLGKDYTFEFSTPRPHLVHMTPGDEATHLEPKQTFELRFNQPVDPKEVERATKIAAGAKGIGFVASRPKSDVPMLVKLTPKTPLPLDAEITITVDASLRGLEGPLPSGASAEKKVHTYGPLVVSEVDCSKTDKRICHPHGSVHVELSNRVSYKDFKAHVRVEPPVPLRWSKMQNDDDKVQWMGVPVDLGPARTYRVVVTPGLRDEYGQTLAREHAVTLTTDDERPDVTIGLSGSVFEAAKAKGKDVPISSLNVDRFEAISGAADENGLLKLLSTRHHRTEDTYRAARALPGAKIEDVKPGAPRNTPAIKNVNADALLGPKGRGLMFVGISRTMDKRASHDVHYVSVTDLALSAKISRFGSLVLVTRLSDGKPVANATVLVREDTTGRELTSVTTDARGIAILSADRFQPVHEDGSIDEHLVLIARSPSGDDWTYREANDIVRRADTPYIDLAAQMPVFGMLFTDRGLYKAGETIKVKGVFRRNLPKGMETPRGTEMTIRAMDPEGAVMFDHTAKLGPFGEIAVDIPIPATAHLGHVQLEALTAKQASGGKRSEEWEPTPASTGVTIAAYRPAEFKVAVDPSQPAFVRGDKATFAVRGDYLFGAPMSGGKVRYTATRTRSYFTPPKTDDLVVNDEAFHAGLVDASPRYGKIQGGDGALSEKGAYEAQVALALPKQDGTENITFEAEVEDLSRQTIASSTTAVVHPAEAYVALKPPKDSFVSLGAGGASSLKAEVAAVEPSGARRANVNVKVDLVSRTWQTATEVLGDDDTHFESRPVDKIVGSCEVKTTTDLASCDLAVKEAGFYVVHARATDKRGNPVAASYSFYASGDNARVAWPVFDGPHLDLVTDKKSYEIGDTAKVLIKSPFTEAEALVTIERRASTRKRRSPCADRCTRSRCPSPRSSGRTRSCPSRSSRAAPR